MDTGDADERADEPREEVGRDETGTDETGTDETGPDDGGDVLPPGTPNACGGATPLAWDGTAASPGDRCGCTGTLVCNGVEGLLCANDTLPNLCGGCGTLPASPGESCGSCGTGRYICRDGGLACEGARRGNLCGGCDVLTDAGGTPGAPGAPCGDNGVWACESAERITCRGDVAANACGGTGALAWEGLDALPGDACEAGCGAGVLVCDATSRELRCDGPEPNACGCDPLAFAVGTACGCEGRGRWQCAAAGGVVCVGGDTNACGGCDALTDAPGTTCAGGDVRACVAPNATACLSRTVARNACGGERTLSAVPGTRCGTCDSGRVVCRDAETTRCEGDRGASARNACNGCTTLPGALNDACGTCAAGTLACDGAESLQCSGNPGAGGYNACGGCGTLPGTPGTACGTCAVWRCGGGTLQCTYDAGAAACGGTRITCADLRCAASNRRCTDATATTDATCGACLDGYAEEAGACVVPPRCGDGVVNGTEACDGSVPAGVTCESRGFVGGTLSCTAACAIEESGCTRPPDDAPPEVTTAPVASATVTATSALLEGSVTSLGRPNPTQHGFCRGATANPAVGGAGVTCSTLGARSATGGFSETVTGLSAATTYHVRAYATNAAGTAYGTSRSFTTAAFRCGDGLVTGTEDCDGGVGGATCDDFSFVGGDLGCGSDCRYDTSGCFEQLCGDDIVSGTEVCDGAVPAGVTCVSEGFTSGTPSCAEDCGSIDTSGCRRLAEVTTSEVATGTVTAGGARLDGTVTSLGVPNPTQHGFCRGASANPAVGGAGVTCSTLGARSATGSFSETATGLSAATTYHVRAYATNTAGTAYGTSRSFTTTPAAAAPTVTTTSATSASATTATAQGNLTALGFPTDVTAHGFCVGTALNPTDCTSLGARSTTGAFSTTLTGLTPSTTYFVRAYATNATGTSYGGSGVSFVTPAAPVAPTVTTTSAAADTSTSAQLAGRLTDLGEPATATAHGFCVGTAPNPTTCTSLGARSTSGVFSTRFTGLTPETTYYARAYATNASGTGYGGEGIVFTTPPTDAPPTVSTVSAVASGHATADLAGNLGALGFPATVTAHGFCVGLSPSPTACTSLGERTTVGAFSTTATMLEPEATYYARAWARNATGTSYGVDRVFTTDPEPLPPDVATFEVFERSPGVVRVTGEIFDVGYPTTIVAYGFCWGTSPAPTTCTSLGIRGGPGEFNTDLTGLAPATRYWVRAYADNGVITTYAPEYGGDGLVFDTAPALPAIGAFCSSDGQCASGNCTDESEGSRLHRCAPRVLTGAATMDFRYVPPGLFDQGVASSSSRFPSRITRGYFVGSTEVTQGQWKAATAGVNPSCFQSTSGGSCSTSNANNNGPVEQVDWYAAAAYANWLSNNDGDPDTNPCYTITPSSCRDQVSDWSDGTAADQCTGITWSGTSCTGYRLLTESEWEWAARGPVNGAAVGSTYYWGEGDTLAAAGQYAWYGSNAGGRTQAVGGKLPNAYGLYDMSGNVWEWVWDWFGLYPSTGTDYTGAATGSSRVIRGGSWSNDASNLASAYRFNYSPSNRFIDFGFRLARTAP